MSGVNKVLLLGNLGADPALRYSTEGSAVCTLSLATSRRWKNRDGKQQEDTQWHRVVAFGRTAETCKEHLVRGRQVFVEGRLQTREWEKDGAKRWTTEVIAEQVTFVGGARGTSEPPPDSGPPPGDDDRLPF